MSENLTDLQEFLLSCTNPPFTLSLISFAHELDKALCSTLSERYKHIEQIVQQAYSVSIPAHIIHNILDRLGAESLTNPSAVINHDKDIRKELENYSMKSHNLFNLPSSIYCLPDALEPSIMSCPNCSGVFSHRNARHSIVRIYHLDGSVSKHTMVHYQCSSSHCALEVFPNFISVKSSKENYRYTTVSLFSNGKFIYLGGDTGFDRSIFHNYANLLTLGHLAFSTYTRVFNQQKNEPPDPPLNRLLFERHFLVYSLVQFQLFMGEQHAFFPFNICTGLAKFINNNIQHFYVQFVKFWGDHREFKSCSSSINSTQHNHCSKCMIVDGHMKIRRRICANTSVSLVLPSHLEYIFEDVLVGCSHSPAINSLLCDHCKNAGVKMPPRKKRTTLKDKTNIRRKEKRRNQQTFTNSMSGLSCNVHKDDMLMDSSVRSCGILLITTNCQVIVGFAEILRSESKKEVLQALCNIFSILPSLPRIIVYDAGCILVKFLRNNYNNQNSTNHIRISPQSQVLHDSVKWMIDRFHLNNHVQDFCKKELNPDRDPELKSINTSACEQVNNWLKGFSHILSNMNEPHFMATLLLVAHLRNCNHTSISCRSVNSRSMFSNNNDQASV